MIQKQNEYKHRLDLIYQKKSIIYQKTHKKSKPHLFFIKEGVITFNVFIDKLNCQCSTNDNCVTLCDHLLYILYDYYYISEFALSFLLESFLKDEFSKYISQKLEINQLNSKLESKIQNYFQHQECGICLVSLSAKCYKFELYQCDKCKNYVHQRCMNQWLDKNKYKHKGCIYCGFI